MKIKNRDINIFSMSALDLFASGMGAFILLAVISLPYFGNVSKIPTEAPLECPVPEVCPKPVPCEVCPPPTPPGFQKLEKLDLVVVLDITGSMRDEIDSLKAEIEDIAEILQRLSDDAHLRVVVFGDDGFDRPVTGFALTAASDAPALKRQVEQIEVDLGLGSGGNNTNGEAVYPGFAEALDTAWRAGVEQQVIIIITDDQPHPGDNRLLTSDVRDFVAGGADNSVSVRYLGSDQPTGRYYEELAKIDGKGSYGGGTDGSVTAALLLGLLPL